WNIVCSSHISSGVFRVPYGQKFLLQPLTFNGECRPKNITFQIDGILIAPSDPSSWKCNDTNCNNWITFQHFDGLIVQGIGSLHGKWVACIIKWYTIILDFCSFLIFASTQFYTISNYIYQYFYADSFVHPKKQRYAFTY
ncbi:hypothetical protein Gotri_012127, partial [Gossypium trilobum]|nr:hypothetical protein [Gossypium trilobum]